MGKRRRAPHSKAALGAADGLSFPGMAAIHWTASSPQAAAEQVVSRGQEIGYAARRQPLWSAVLCAAFPFRPERLRSVASRDDNRLAPPRYRILGLQSSPAWRNPALGWQPACIRGHNKYALAGRPGVLALGQERPNGSPGERDLRRRHSGGCIPVEWGCCSKRLAAGSPRSYASSSR